MDELLIQLGYALPNELQCVSKVLNLSFDLSIIYSFAAIISLLSLLFSHEFIRRLLLLTVERFAI